MQKGRETLIASGNFGANAAMDNTNIPTPRKYQWNGISSNMNMYTPTYLFFFKVHLPPREMVNNELSILHCPITYIKQPIPTAVFRMPPYHLHLVINSLTFQPPITILY